MIEWLRAVCVRLLRIASPPSEAALRQAARDLQTALTKLEKEQK